MLGLFHALRAALTPSSSPARISRTLRGPDHEPIGVVDELHVTPDGIALRARLSPEGIRLVGPGLGGVSIAEAWLAAHGSDVQLEPWQRHVLLDGGIEVSPRVASPLLDAENRRASIERELHAADPRPDLERARALAEYSQTRRPGHDEQEFAWQAYVDAGVSAGTAVVQRLES